MRDGLGEIDPLEQLTIEQVRAVINTYLKNRDLPPPERTERFKVELVVKGATKSETLRQSSRTSKPDANSTIELGIDVDE